MNVDLAQRKNETPGARKQRFLNKTPLRLEAKTHLLDKRSGPEISRRAFLALRYIRECQEAASIKFDCDPGRRTISSYQPRKSSACRC